MKTILTVEDLEKMGIYKSEGELSPNKFFIPHLGDTNLYEPYDINIIFEKIYNKGYEDGERMGRKNKINEIKAILDIDYED